MRKWLSLAALLAALAYPGPAAADTPAQVYSDFAQDGALSCGHSRAALKGALSDASLQQYGDPYTYLGLKLAVRKELAGGCRRGDGTGTLFSRQNGAADPDSSGQGSPGAAKSSGSVRERRNKGSESRGSTESADVGAALGAEDSRDGRMVLLGVALLLLTLGSGGWAAKRAYTDR